MYILLEHSLEMPLVAS